ncbi:transposase [Streptomyces shenzhenensis]|uniref:transposase n=1 Tax=Streptomyces shenzhenensis TaxID=943815 RepID=UPI003D930E9D
MAGTICVRPGHETPLVHRTRIYRGRTGEKKGFGAREFTDLPASARRQLGDVPPIAVRDNTGTRHAKPLREFCERNSDWPTIAKLPPHPPDLNPAEGVRAHAKKPLANLARSKTSPRSRRTAHAASNTDPKYSTASSPGPDWHWSPRNDVTPPFQPQRQTPDQPLRAQLGGADLCHCMFLYHGAAG